MDHQVPPPSDPRPPSPPGPPPLPGPPTCETQPNQDISPAVAAALLQLISQQDHGEAAHRSKDPSPVVEAPAQLPPPWAAADSPPKSSAEAPAGLGTPVPAQFPKDQDLRFSHGAAR